MFLKIFRVLHLILWNYILRYFSLYFSQFFYFSTFSHKISGKIVFRVFNLFILFSGKNFFPTVFFFFISVVELFRQNVCFFNSGGFFLLKLVLFCFTFLHVGSRERRFFLRFYFLHLWNWMKMKSLCSDMNFSSSEVFCVCQSPFR